MIDNHLARQALAAARRFRRVRPGTGRSKHMPREFSERAADLVCVVGEANAWPLENSERRVGDELVHWVARRMVSGETFDVVAAPQHALSPSTPGHIEIGADRLAAAASREELFAAFDEFLRPDDLICAWGGYSLRLFQSSGGVLPPARMDVRAVARRITRGAIGTVEAFAEKAVPDGEQPPETLAPLATGRAGRRLGALVRIVESWTAAD